MTCRVLSIDGGGMRGLYAATYLDTLERAFSERRGCTSGLDVGKAFQLIVGTSTGAIIGCGLAKGVPDGAALPRPRRKNLPAKNALCVGVGSACSAFPALDVSPIVPDFALDLYNRFLASATFQRHVLALHNEPRAPFVWLRWAVEVRYVRFSDAAECLQDRIGQARVAEIVRTASTFSQSAYFLRRVAGIDPRGTAQVLVRMWDQERRMLLQRLIAEPNAITLTSDLYILSTIHRRTALSAAWQLKFHIGRLLADEKEYDKAGSSLDNIRRHLSQSLAREVTLSLDVDRLVAGIKIEQRRFANIGRFLETAADVSRDLAEQLFRQLDYWEHIRAIAGRYMFNCVPLIRGFLRACPAPEFLAVLHDLQIGGTVAQELRTAWKSSNSTSELAYCVSHLLRTPIPKAELPGLLGFSHVLEIANDLISRLAQESSTVGVANCLYVLTALDADAARRGLEVYWQGFELEAAAAAAGDLSSKHGKLSTRSLPQGYRSTDVTDLAFLLRVSVAIDETTAIRILELVDIARFTEYSAADPNFGRLAMLFGALHETSRKYAREAVRLTATQEAWRDAYLAGNGINSWVHYARALGSISRKAMQAFAQFIIGEFRDDLIDHLENEANVGLIASWVRTAAASEAIPSDALAPFVALLVSTTDADQRLWQLMEACEALIECGESVTARAIAAIAQDQVAQMASVRDLKTWIQIVQKALRISRELELDTFVGEIIRGIPTWYLFARVVGFEDNVVLQAFAYYLIKTSGFEGSEWASEVSALRKGVLENTDNDPRAIARALAWMLVGGPEAELTPRTAAEWKMWERGLCALVFSIGYPQGANPFTVACEAGLEASWSAISNRLNEHTTNLHYALTLHLASVSGLGDVISESQRQEALSRADDEVSGATRWLLQNYRIIPFPKELSHYLWHFLTNTVLSASYLAWDEPLEESAKSISLDQKRAS